MYCGSKTIAIQHDNKARAFPLRCRAWTCPECAPRRRRQLIADAMDGAPNRFITLTVNPHWFDSPAERGARLAAAWRAYVKFWRKKRPSGTMQYLVVLELTKRGEPHLHIMIRGGRVPQAELSKFMNEAIGAPIVDVRMIREQSQVAQYVAKYISKRPIRLGNLKRYWRSMGYFTDEAKAKRNTKKPRNSIWLIDEPLKSFSDRLWKIGTFNIFPHDGMLLWVMYDWEPRPIADEALFRRIL